MSAIEVLKKDLKSYESLKANNKIIKTLNNEEVCMIHYPEIKEAIVALQQKDCVSHWQPKEYCKQCIEFAFEDGEREGRKKGALEELKRIEEAWHHIGSKGVCNYIEKRIKELEEEGVEQK